MSLKTRNCAAGFDGRWQQRKVDSNSIAGIQTTMEL